MVFEGTTGVNERIVIVSIPNEYESKEIYEFDIDLKNFFFVCTLI